MVSFLFPNFEVQDVVREQDQLTIIARALAQTASCPSCGRASSRVHSYYQRHPQDLPMSGQHVRLVLQVRRFRCLNSACPRRTFAERLSTVAASARHTNRLARVLECLALALSGQSGSRLATHLGISVSPDSLLRRAKKPISASATGPKLLGVDDFAFRRGHTYGTILVDLTTHQPVDLLADRTAESFANWLRTHPGVEVISRDRGGAYAEGGSVGAPSALQVADRWHVLHNLAEGLERLFRRYETVLASQPEAKRMVHPLVDFLSASQHGQAAEFQRVQALYEQGTSLISIANQLHIDYNKLRYFVQSQPWARSKRPGRHADLQPFLAQVHRLWTSGERNGRVIWQKLRASGYQGAASNLRPYLALLRQFPELAKGRRSSRKQTRNQGKEGSVRRLVAAVFARPKQRTTLQTQMLTHASQAHPDLAEALMLAQSFIEVVRERQTDTLLLWLGQAKESSVAELRQFAQGIERDQMAVEAALKRSESQGQVEGQINKLKFIKRSMFGRAGFDLLRSRILKAA